MKSSPEEERFQNVLRRGAAEALRRRGAAQLGRYGATGRHLGCRDGSEAALCFKRELFSFGAFGFSTP